MIKLTYNTYELQEVSFYCWRLNMTSYKQCTHQMQKTRSLMNLKGNYIIQKTGFQQCPNQNTTNFNKRQKLLTFS